MKLILSIILLSIPSISLADTIKCYFEYSEQIFYSINVNTSTLGVSMTAPRMIWRGYASLYSNIEQDKYFINFGSSILELTKTKSNTNICLDGKCFSCISQEN